MLFFFFSELYTTAFLLLPLSEMSEVKAKATLVPFSSSPFPECINYIFQNFSIVFNDFNNFAVSLCELVSIEKIDPIIKAFILSTFLYFKDNTFISINSQIYNKLSL